MKIVVGSKNAVKIDAVKEALQGYDFLKNAQIDFKEVSSEVSDQPKSLDEAIRGAMNRAKNAFSGGLSFGIEDGLMAVPHTKTGYMNVTTCAIYDGKNFHLGLSAAFEWPVEVTRLLLEEGLNVNQAFHKVGLTEKKEIGSHEGAVSVLTKGRTNRQKKTQEAILMALIHLENEGLYKT